MKNKKKERKMLRPQHFSQQILEHPQQWSYFFSYFASQKVTLSILPTYFTKHPTAVDLF